MNSRSDLGAACISVDGDRGSYGLERRKFRKKSVGELLDLLSSDDLRTRFLAEMTLRDATGT